MTILEKILKEASRLEKSTPPLHIIFDLDSTLYDVRPRTKKILHDFSETSQFLKAYPKECSILKEIEMHQKDYGLREVLKREKILHSENFIHDLIQFWKDRFFSSEYLKYDHAYKGASKYIEELEKFGAQIIYLTGRDTHRMRKGTIESLKQWSFPLDQEHIQLIMKPHKSMDDALFKRDYLKDFTAPNWFFENEPVNIELVLKDCPHINIVFFDSVHSGEAKAPYHLPTIQSWVF